MTKLIILCVIMASFAIFAACKNKKTTMFENLSSNDFAHEFAADTNAVLLDVRTDAEVMQGIIPQSIHIDIQKYTFADEVEKLDKTKNYYIYCRSGGRSSTACQYLRTRNFLGKIVNLDGGITHWEGEVTQ